MFEAAELGETIDRETFKKESVKIRTALLKAQKQLASAEFSVVIIVSGVEGAGKSETANLLLEWMDARGIQIQAMWKPSDEENERPEYWRFWRVLPARGRMGIFFGSWYTEPLIDRVFMKCDDAAFNKALDGITDLERMLTRDNVLILKFWMHISKPVQKARLKTLAADKRTLWRVTKRDWKYFKKYDDFKNVSQHAIRKTNTAEAPWHIIDASDERYRGLTVTRILLDALQKRLSVPRHIAHKKPTLPVPVKINIINQLDMNLALSKERYEKRLLKYSGRLNMLSHELHQKKRSLLVVLEGSDAGGKGGAIRRMTGAMDARTYQVISVAKPTDEERAHPYLWRFWRHLPRLGRVTIFDRSWYGRVLVERIEGFCTPEDWQRAYAEINSFEEQIADFGIAIVKFWLAVTPDEQLRRFKDRESTAYKQYKLTEEDWRNRDKWEAYEAAACDMVEKTSTEIAPWTMVEANNKYWARIKVLKTVCDRLESALAE